MRKPPARPCAKAARWQEVAASIMLLAGTILLGGIGAKAQVKRLTWKPITQAVLKLNNRPVKTWNVYQPAKNRNLVLVQVNKSWYVFQLKEKRVYQAERRDFQARDGSLIGPEPGKSTPVVKTQGWDSHDVGPAQQITVQITATGDVLAVELPHPLALY